MAGIFAERRLVSSFRSRSVVFSMRSALKEKNLFFTQMNLEFGSNGYIGLRTIINLTALKTAKDRGVQANETQAATDKLVAHFKTIVEFIRLFEETIAWLKEPGPRFHMSASVGFNPLFIHGSRTDREVRIEVFGRNTEELNLGFESSNHQQLVEGVGRLNDLRDCLITYRDAFATVDLDHLISLEA